MLHCVTISVNCFGTHRDALLTRCLGQCQTGFVRDVSRHSSYQHPSGVRTPRVCRRSPRACLQHQTLSSRKAAPLPSCKAPPSGLGWGRRPSHHRRRRPAKKKERITSVVAGGITSRESTVWGITVSKPLAVIYLLNTTSLSSTR